MQAIRHSLMRWGVLMLFGVMLFAASAVPVFAQDGSGDVWDDVIVTFGTVTLAWASVQMGAINILKGIAVQGRPILDTAGKVWLANSILGVIGLVIAATQGGMSLIAAIIQAVLVVFAAAGEYEGVKVNMGKGKSLDGTGSEENGPTQPVEP